MDKKAFQQLGACDAMECNAKQGVCHTVALPFTLINKYLKAKEEL
jgi:hypothetical protein